MNKDELQSAVTNIEAWLSKQMLYYCIRHEKYYIGYYSGMGNFDVNELPNEYQGLIFDRELDDFEAQYSVISKMSLIDRQKEELKVYAVSLKKVLSANVVGR
ncbi:hypothetical protein [uncultured Alteromonas sp.]|jgi:hypothetical protein|uniref:hypothetical protein n=1 Tax=uncultured Alteromonas sp. TaxID=179113 RepID=UPI0030EDAEF2|tara:strand:+ start:6236 stop:6541 length:306 start_codon:yes stop_codon:yes gene_type:complete